MLKKNPSLDKQFARLKITGNKTHTGIKAKEAKKKKKKKKAESDDDDDDDMNTDFMFGGFG